MTSSSSQPVALVIDDEIQIRRFLKLALEAEGYRVFEAGTGQDGLTSAVYGLMWLSSTSACPTWMELKY